MQGRENISISSGPSRHRPTHNPQPIAFPLASEELCRQFWQLCFGFIRNRGHGVEESQDLTQEFFRHLLENGWLEQLDLSSPSCRAYLFASLDHFLANNWRKVHAAKRGGGRTPLSLEADPEQGPALQATTNLDPSRQFERSWLDHVLEIALNRLRAQYEAAGRNRLFEAMHPFLTGEVEAGDSGKLAQDLGLSHGAVSTSLCRLRKRYGELVREEIFRALKNPQDLDDELRSLLRAVA